MYSTSDTQGLGKEAAEKLMQRLLLPEIMASPNTGNNQEDKTKVLQVDQLVVRVTVVTPTSTFCFLDPHILVMEEMVSYVGQ